MLVASNHAALGDNLTNFPPSFSYDGLSVLLGRSIPSLQSDLSRKPWALPPFCKIPGTKAPIWLLRDVLDWLAAHRAPAVEPPPGVVVTHPARRGRPPKIEKARRDKLNAELERAAAEIRLRAPAAKGGAQ